MNKNESELIREVIGYEIKATPTMSFTEDTLNKMQNIQYMQGKRTKTNLWHPLFIPVALYVVLMLLLSLIKMLINIVPVNNINFLHTILSLVNRFLQDSITLACLTSFLLLFLLNSYLSKIFYRKSLSEMKRI